MLKEKSKRSILLVKLGRIRIRVFFRGSDSNTVLSLDVVPASGGFFLGGKIRMRFFSKVGSRSKKTPPGSETLVLSESLFENRTGAYLVFGKLKLVSDCPSSN